MRSFRVFVRKLFFLIAVLCLVLATGLLVAQTPSTAKEPASAESPAQGPQTQPSTPEAQAQIPKYDKAIFRDPISSDQFAFLNHFAGKPSNDLVRDKQYRKLMRSLIPDCVFHYGWDIQLSDALEKVLRGSSTPVQIRDGRYVIASGRNGPYLQGRGFMWIDMQEGIALGGFFFHPTNGEPTPTVTIFSRQVKEESLGMSQLPAAFVEALNAWAAESGLPELTTRYFITGGNKKILLEHDQDYCANAGVTTRPASCEQLNADAADIDLNAAYYLEQTNHATNATAWMIVGPEQVSWIQVRENTCGVDPGQLGCRIRITRERVHVIINRHSVAQIPHVQPPHK